MTRGKPRTNDTIFFGEKWLAYVESTPHGRVVAGVGDHWIFHENPQFVNAAIAEWLGSLGLAR
jgi:hypothetical protein